MCSSESSDWEAKFYQIQSKYLFLLNELHNPQVGVSASREEMVSQLLKVKFSENCIFWVSFNFFDLRPFLCRKDNAA